MNILIVDLCSDPLSSLEFAEPVERILKRRGIKAFVKHYRSIRPEDFESIDKVIISGSPLMDRAFLSNDWSSWLSWFNKPVLGLGSGLQAIARAFGNRLTRVRRIGIFRVRVIKPNKLVGGDFHAFFLARGAAVVDKPFEALAVSGKLGCILKHESKEIYGCLFQPEVMNPEIIINFALMV